MSKNQITKLSRSEPREKVRQIKRHTDEEHVPKELQKFMKQGPWTKEKKVGKLREFVDCLVPFTEKQVVMLLFVGDEIKKVCEDYQKYDGTWGLFFTRLKYKKDHSDLATQLLKDIQNKDPQQQLQELFKVRDKLTKDKPGDLLKGLDGIALNAFNRMLEGVPEEYYKKAPGKN